MIADTVSNPKLVYQTKESLVNNKLSNDKPAQYFEVLPHSNGPADYWNKLSFGSTSTEFGIYVLKDLFSTLTILKNKMAAIFQDKSILVVWLSSDVWFRKKNGSMFNLMHHYLLWR